MRYPWIQRVDCTWISSAQHSTGLSKSYSNNIYSVKEGESLDLRTLPSMRIIVLLLEVRYRKPSELPLNSELSTLLKMIVMKKPPCLISKVPNNIIKTCHCSLILSGCELLRGSFHQRRHPSESLLCGRQAAALSSMVTFLVLPRLSLVWADLAQQLRQSGWLQNKGAKSFWTSHTSQLLIWDKPSFLDTPTHKVLIFSLPGVFITVLGQELCLHFLN